MKDQRKNKLLLREFLLKCLSEKSCAGVGWVDQKEMIFQIPWKHMAKTDWSDEDGTIFKVIQNDDITNIYNDVITSLKYTII